MTTIKDQHLSGERPLYNSHDLQLHRVTIGEGESGLKECRHIEAHDCRFEGMYILWECVDAECRNCEFTATDRAPMWYNRDLRLYHCHIDAPKALREIDGLSINRLKITEGAETFWYCRNGVINYLQTTKAEYAFAQSEKLVINHLTLTGKYTFQYAREIEIHNAVLDTKDAFWNSIGCTIYDSEIKGEYLGWYSRNLHLVRCRISGTQPLCYCENLVLEDCTFAPDADLAFEYSSVQARILGSITSIKNPLSGSITCRSCDRLILDEHAKAPNNCIIRYE